MNTMSFVRRSVLGAICCLALSSFANPVERPVQNLERVESTGLLLETTLSKNLFRTETYQDNYTVDVPYQVNETYYEDVPYTERVPYTDYEEYYENEWQCRTVIDHRRECRDERVCRQVPGAPVCRVEQDCRTKPGDPVCRVERQCRQRPGERECRVEQECRTKPNGEQVCRDRQVCDRGPDREECEDRRVCHPGPDQRVCRDRQVCEPGPSREECRQVERCRDIPVSRQECGFEPVRRTRPVTRYREETRYRREERTRTVTRWRQETRCCVTRERQVFDRQWTLPVTVRFPVGSELRPGEKENFRVRLLGTETQPLVSFEVRDAIYGYRVLTQTVTPAGALFELELVPLFQAADLGESKLKSLVLKSATGAWSVNFSDELRHPRVETTYFVLIRDPVTGDVLSEAQAVAGPLASTSIPLPGASWSADKDLVIELRLLRQGPVIENGLFETTISKPHSGVLDVAALRNPALLGGLGVQGEKQAAELVFFDQSPVDARVSTRYRISTARLTSDGKKVYLSVKDIDRATLSVGLDGLYHLSLLDLGVAPAALNSHFGRGQTVYLSLEVFRTSPLVQGQIPLWKGGNFKVP